MKQVLLIEASEKTFLKLMDEKIKEGFKLIAGSTVIKSHPSTITLPQGEIINDLEHIFTIAISGEYDYFIYSKNITTFSKEVNDKLIEGEYRVVTGSFNVNLKKLDGYKEQDRVYTTYYCCALYKE
jgi:hypothetical protein